MSLCCASHIWPLVPVMVLSLPLGCGGGGSSDSPEDSTSLGGTAGTSAVSPGAGRGPTTTTGTVTVFTESVGRKVQPSTAVGSDDSLDLAGPRRSYQAGQVVVHAADGDLAGVQMEMVELTNESGDVIDPDQASFYLEYFIDMQGAREGEPGNEPVPQSSPTGDSRIPDPLIPFVDPYTGNSVGSPFSVVDGDNQPIWVDIHIPESASPGVYQGEITVSAQDRDSVSVPVQLTVYDVVLPDMRSVTTHFASQFDEAIRYHDNLAECSGGDCWLGSSSTATTVVKRYEELAHEHRIDPGPYQADEAPESCTAPTNFNSWDASMQAYMDGSYYSDGVPSTWFDMPFTPGADWGPDAECTEAQYTAVAAAWASHLKEKGWFDRAIIYALDEPPPESFADIARNSAWLQAGDPDWRSQVMDTVAATPDSTFVLDPALGIYCVCLRCFGPTYEGQDDLGRAQWQSRIAQGQQLWFYESNAQGDPYPTFATNTLIGEEPRIIMWGSWFEGATGFLLWDTVAWNFEAPWGPNDDYNKTGDGVLIYPGNHDGLDAPAGSPSWVTIDGPIPSYRLKMVRAGLQDWALFRYAEQQGQGDLVRTQVARAYGQFGGCDWNGCPALENGEFYWKSDPALIEDIRKTILEAL